MKPKMLKNAGSVEEKTKDFENCTSKKAITVLESSGLPVKLIAKATRQDVMRMIMGFSDVLVRIEMIPRVS